MNLRERYLARGCIKVSAQKVGRKCEIMRKPQLVGTKIEAHTQIKQLCRSDSRAPKRAVPCHLLSEPQVQHTRYVACASEAPSQRIAAQKQTKDFL